MGQGKPFPEPASGVPLRSYHAYRHHSAKATFRLHAVTSSRYPLAAGEFSPEPPS